MEKRDFMDELKNNIDGDVDNASVTENGAIGYKSTGKALLDLNFSVSSMRQMPEGEIRNKFRLAWNDGPELALKWLFYARDIRGGLGERRLFRVILKDIVSNATKNGLLSDAIKRLIPLIPEYGRWDDLFCMMDTPMEEEVLLNIAHQLKREFILRQNGDPISLLTKWLPSINTSSAETRKLAYKISKFLHMNEKEYRKLLAAGRKYIKIVERQMSENQWHDINYEAVPSKANLLYGNAFARHDADRRAEYLAALENGHAKINSGTLFPHEIVSKIRHDDNVDCNLMNELWKALPNKCTKNTRTLVVADGSQSMETRIASSKAQALDVAIAMAIYFSERLTGEFANRFVTFSSSPKFVSLGGCPSLQAKISYMRRFCEVSDTNIEAVFDMILSTAVGTNMKQEDLPDNILIISDMEFNRCAITNNGISSVEKALFDYFASRFRTYGYKLPRLIFWNVCSRTGTIPVKENDMGVTLISGFSINTLNLVMSDILDPYECLVNQLMNKRYEPIKL